MTTHNATADIPKVSTKLERLIDAYGDARVQAHQNGNAPKVWKARASLNAAIRALQDELANERERFDHIAQNPGYWIEVEEGAACCGSFRGVDVCNGQATVEACFDQMRARVWDGGVMRPEFSARLAELRSATPEADHG